MKNKEMTEMAEMARNLLNLVDKAVPSDAGWWNGAPRKGNLPLDVRTYGFLRYGLVDLIGSLEEVMATSSEKI